MIQILKRKKKLNTLMALFDSPYNDQQLQWGGIPLLCLFVIHLGIDDSLSYLLSQRFYFTNLFSSLIAAYFIFFSIRRLILFFNLLLPWGHGKNTKRWSIQFIFSAAISFIGLLFSEIFNYWMNHNDLIFDDHFLSLDFPLTTLIVLGLNYYYYSLEKYQSLTKTYLEVDVPVFFDKADNATAQTIVLKTFSGHQSFDLENVAFFHLENNITCLIFSNGKSMKVDQTLSSIMPNLNSSFFQLNRQFIVNKKAIKAYKTLSNHKLSIQLNITFKNSPAVSKNKAAQFKRWYLNKL